MIVLGGVYREICDYPDRHSQAGSGLRAAAVLSAIGRRIPTLDVSLYTARADNEADILDLVLNGLDLDVQWHARTSPIGFHYQTPLSPPSIDGIRSRIDADKVIHVKSHSVLCFGMIETSFDQIRIEADRVVVDPQQPRDEARLNLDGIEGEIAIVLNQSEARLLGGQGRLSDDATAILDQNPKATVVVTKRGPRGALVTSRESQNTVGPFPSRSVWPIGTGDVFAAGFAYAWGHVGEDAVTAARMASQMTAAWAGTSSYEAPARVLGADPSEHELPVDDRAQVYLAGPFFSLPARWLIDLVRPLLGRHFSPMHEVGHGGPEVALADMDGLEKSSGVLALLDGSDPGTLYEAGWAGARHKPVIGYTERPDEEAWKLLVGLNNEVHSDLATAVYRAVWASMGMPLND